MGPVAAAAVGAGISGLVGLFGSERANRQRAQQAEAQMGFQERMRNTAWQAAVEDMRAAGINPALAYQQGAAAAPGGAQAQVENSIASAMQAAQASKTLQLMEHQVQKAKAEATSAGAAARLDKERASLLLPSDLGIMRRDGTEYRAPSLLSEMVQLEVDAARVGVQNTRENAKRTAELAKIAGVGGDLAEEFGMLLPLLGIGGQGIAGASRILRNLRNPRR